MNHKQSTIQFFQNKNQHWYIQLTYNGAEIPERYCPHFQNTNECEWYWNTFGSNELVIPENN